MPLEHEAQQRTAYNAETCAAKGCVQRATDDLPHRSAPLDDEGKPTKGKPVTVFIGYCPEHYRIEVARRLAARTAP